MLFHLSILALLFVSFCLCLYLFHYLHYPLPGPRNHDVLTLGGCLWNICSKVSIPKYYVLYYCTNYEMHQVPSVGDCYVWACDHNSGDRSICLVAKTHQRAQLCWLIGSRIMLFTRFSNSLSLCEFSIRLSCNTSYLPEWALFLKLRLFLQELPCQRFWAIGFATIAICVVSSVQLICSSSSRLRSSLKGLNWMGLCLRGRN